MNLRPRIYQNVLLRVWSTNGSLTMQISKQLTPTNFAAIAPVEMIPHRNAKGWLDDMMVQRRRWSRNKEVTYYGVGRFIFGGAKDLLDSRGENASQGQAHLYCCGWTHQGRHMILVVRNKRRVLLLIIHSTKTVSLYCLIRSELDICARVANARIPNIQTLAALFIPHPLDLGRPTPLLQLSQYAE